MVPVFGFVRRFVRRLSSDEEAAESEAQAADAERGDGGREASGIGIGQGVKGGMGGREVEAAQQDNDRQQNEEQPIVIGEQAGDLRGRRERERSAAESRLR